MDITLSATMSTVLNGILAKQKSDALAKLVAAKESGQITTTQYNEAVDKVKSLTVEHLVVDTLRGALTQIKREEIRQLKEAELKQEVLDYRDGL